MPAFDRGACERRVYRLSCLLGGDPALALRVIESVIDVPAGMASLDGAHLDRLTILRTRELIDRPRPLAGIDPILARRFADLPFQHREAWVLREVYGIEPRDAARAMDCSVTALERHLAGARSGIEQSAGEGEALSEALRARSLELSPPKLLRKQRRTIARVRRVLRIVLRVAMLLAILAVVAAGAYAVIHQLGLASAPPVG